MPPNIDQTKLDNPLYIIGIMAVCLLTALYCVRFVLTLKQDKAMANGGNPVTKKLDTLIEVTEREHRETRKSMADTAAETAKALREHNDECDHRWTNIRRVVREKGEG